MLVKKLAIAAASAALVLGAFAPAAFADVNVTNHGGVIVNSTTLSNTGSNSVLASDEATVVGSNVVTGTSTASNTVGTELNNNSVSVNDTTGGRSEVGEVSVSNCGFTTVTVVTGSNSGDNHISAVEDGATVVGSYVNTGNASAGSNVQTLVNVNSVSVTASGSNDIN